MTSTANDLLIVNNAIPPLREIDDLYHTAANLQSRLDAETASCTASSSERKTFRTWACAIGVLMLGYYLSGLLFGMSTASSLLFVWLAAAVIVYKVLKKAPLPQSGTLQALAADTEAQIAAISENVEQIAQANADAINALPRDYRFYDAAVFFENMLANRRADSLKEAVNLYENFLHQQRLEEINLEALRENERQSRMLASIDRSSGIAATFTVLNYLK